jgi:SsrA-binding protein
VGGGAGADRHRGEVGAQRQDSVAGRLRRGRERGEAWLCNAHFSPYSHGNRWNHDETRRRKLLLHREEIDKIFGKTRDKGFTLIPTKVYLKNGLVKCEIALARGKKQHDKRATERKREAEAEARVAVRRVRRGD